MSAGDGDGDANKLVFGGKGKCLSRTRPHYYRKCKRARHHDTTTTSIDINPLPADLLFEILVRLPADHLFERARFVCRRWSDIIHSHTFVNAQILHSPYQLLLLCKRRLILITASRGQIETSELSYECRNRLLSSSNGLATAEVNWPSDGHRHIVVLNPATRQIRNIPLSHRLTLNSRLGIAFAASSSKYKFTLPYHKFGQGLLLGALTILTFGVDNSWRDISVEHLPLHVRCLLVNKPPVITEGFMHWVCSPDPEFLTMDVESEVVRVMESPGPRPYYLSTGKFMSVLIGHRNFRWEVFGMDMESGEWRKVVGDIELGVDALIKCVGSTRGQVLKPFGWVKYPEVLAFSYSGNRRACIFYNLVTHEISSTELPYGLSYFKVLVHKNSLTRLP